MKRKDSIVCRIGKSLVSIQYGVSMFMAILLLAMIGYEVIVRYVVKAPLMGIEELMVFPIIWLYLLGGANASYEKSHIECGILTLYIKKERSMLIFDAIKRTLCLIILTWLSGWGIQFFNYSLKVWKIADITSAPLFYANLALTVGFLLMTIYALRDFIQAWRALLRNLHGEKVGSDTSKEEQV